MEIELRSLLRGEGETKAFGRCLGQWLRHGDWIALTGELGSGKTVLVSGVLEAIHPGARVRSPTYVLVEVYPFSPVVVHADLYRLRSCDEYPGLGLEDLAERDAVVLIEWAERAQGQIPPDRLELELRYAGDSARELRIRPHGERWVSLAQAGAFDRERWHDAYYPRD